MKTDIYIITGFLDSGKTTFINGLIKNCFSIDDSILMIQFESGKISINNKLLEKYNINIINMDYKNEIIEKHLKSEIEQYSPDHIVIECNGMQSAADLIIKIQNIRLKKKSKLYKVINIIDAGKFNINPGSELIEDPLIDHIKSSDLFIINNIKDVSKNKISEIKRQIKYINNTAKFSIIPTNSSLNESFTKGKIFNNYLGLKLFIIFILYLMTEVIDFGKFDFYQVDFSKLQTFCALFISIIIQAIPFILIGALVASTFEIFITDDIIAKFFPKNIFLACLSAVAAGFIFPVCDCASIPVARGYIKKGIPLSAAITYMLAAPICNPVVIAATLFAFSGNTAVVIYRILIGIITAVIIGLIFSCVPNEKILLNTRSDSCVHHCHCHTDSSIDENIFDKIKDVLKHTESEFFDIGKYLIIGSFISSLFQTVIPQSVILNMTKGKVIPLLTMMILAFVLSICSTSDAFIAKGFLNQFSLKSVMGFMVLGPMIDIKNTIMLFSTFKKKFCIAYIFTIFFISYIIVFCFKI